DPPARGGAAQGPHHRRNLGSGPGVGLCALGPECARRRARSLHRAHQRPGHRVPRPRVDLRRPPSRVAVHRRRAGRDEWQAAAPTRGAIFGVLSGVLYGVYIFGIHHCRRLAPQFVVAPVEIGTVAAGVMTAVAGLGLGGLDFDLGWDGWAWMIALAVCGQALSWVLLSISSPLVPVPTTAALMLLQPLSAVVLGSLIAGERLQPAQWVG